MKLDLVWGGSHQAFGRHHANCQFSINFIFSLICVRNIEQEVKLKGQKINDSLSPLSCELDFIHFIGKNAVDVCPNSELSAKISKII